MLILAMDSATNACSAAVWQDGQILAYRHETMQRGQSEHLVPMIAQCLEQANVTFDQLDLLAVTVGPGAFTGIRIGLATARALALACGKPLAGVSTTHVVAAAVPSDQRADLNVVVMESHRQDLWVQCFDADLQAMGAVEALTPDQIAARWTGPFCLVGDAADAIAELCPQARHLTDYSSPDARHVAELAARLWPQNACLPPDPLYLRPADVSLPMPKAAPSPCASPISEEKNCS